MQGRSRSIYFIFSRLYFCCIVGGLYYDEVDASTPSLCPINGVMLSLIVIMIRKIVSYLRVHPFIECSNCHHVVLQHPRMLKPCFHTLQYSCPVLQVSISTIGLHPFPLWDKRIHTGIFGAYPKRKVAVPIFSQKIVG